MNFVPDRGVRIGVGLDNADLQILDIFADRAADTFLGAAWLQASKDNVRYVSGTFKDIKSGQHVLRISMIDPAVVVETIIIHTDPLADSYFGPPEVTPV